MNSFIKRINIKLNVQILFLLMLGAEASIIFADNSGAVLTTAKSHYTQQQYRAAIKLLKVAVKDFPESAELHHWLGKAYGREAQRANWLRAPGLAKKTRRHFERAVELDPQYLPGWLDLFEYYLAAPGFLGGGQRPAERAGMQIERLDPVLGAEVADRLQARFDAGDD